MASDRSLSSFLQTLSWACRSCSKFRSDIPTWLEYQDFESTICGLARSLSLKKGKNSSGCKCNVREAAEAMAKEAKRNDLILRTSGTVNVDGSNNLASVFSKRGQKGVNQDCCIVWEEFGCQQDMMFCGIFDGHGQWGHFVAKRIRETMPPSLLCNWQETLLAQTSLDPDLKELDLESDKKYDQRFNVWKHSYIKTCAAVDEELEQDRKINSFYSGSTGLTIVRQGDLIVISNVGDSRAVLGTTLEDGSLVAVQLTVDFKPNLPEEAERITQRNGRVFSLDDETGVYRLWLPYEESPGLAMSRAFGDYCVKDFGLISEPEVTHRNITSRDQFVVLATDGVWDVITNEEAVEIVGSTAAREKCAKRLVECAAAAWKKKRRGYAMDDISAICLFFHSSSSLSQLVHPINLQYYAFLHRIVGRPWARSWSKLGIVGTCSSIGVVDYMNCWMWAEAHTMCLIKSPSFVAKHISTSTRASSLPILFKRQVPLTDKNNNPKNDDEKKESENDDDNVEILLSSLNICTEDDDDYLLSTLNVPLPAPLKVKCSWDLRIAGHCDGIICLKLFIGNVILCNPAMKEFKLLPKSFLLLPEEDFDLWSLDYELDCYTEYLGFGYDPLGKDYKVVRFVIYFESGLVQSRSIHFGFYFLERDQNP
ncbi:hypothetical protein ACLB2K_060843 [Fragaria x ananassa]